MPYPTFKQTLLGGSNGFKPTNPLGAFPAGVSAFDRTFTREYNNQRGAALNQQQTQRAFNSGYRKLMRGARGGDPRALMAMMQVAPKYQRIGDIGTEQYGPNAQDQLNSDEWYRQQGSQALAQNPTAQNQNFNNLWNRQPTPGVNTGVRDTLMQPTGVVPPDPSSVGNTPVANDPFGTGFLPMGENNPFSTSQDQASVMQTGQMAPGLPAPIVNNSANQSYADFSENAASPAVSAMRQPQTPYENAMAAVALRKQQQQEQGIGGEFGGEQYMVDDTEAHRKQVLNSLPSDQRALLREDVPLQSSTRVVPGIGHVSAALAKGPTAHSAQVMTGRYGTGTIVHDVKQTPTKERTIEEIDPATGKKIKMSTTEWFRKSAERQGVANKFAENEAQIRRIMGTNYQPPPPVR